MKRRSFLRAALAAGTFAVTAGSTAACGTSGPGGAPGASGALQLWTLGSPGQNELLQEAVDAFVAAGRPEIEISTYVNDPYKAKLQTAVGSPNAPDIFYSWGGGNLAGYVEAGQVVDLTPALDAQPATRDRFIPSILEVGSLDGRVYGLPMAGTSPVSFFYNTAAFATAGIERFPRSWSEFLAAVEALKAAGIQPIALAGSQAWTEMMYVEYFLDRIGGPEKFRAVLAGSPGAWQDPAMTEAMTYVRQLVDVGAFGTNFAAVNYDNQGTLALVSSGRAAMELQGRGRCPTSTTTSPTSWRAATSAGRRSPASRAEPATRGTWWGARATTTRRRRSPPTSPPLPTSCSPSWRMTCTSTG
ncbi:extracellular solute-binding protein [Pseudonocardia nigra]|uniref:extracellular solute-binding protein n=1 Tax=Pseudonocardia nigra TaxID=1921578 RepID=UPI001C5E2D02|nr:extracellular solute-binding protein [Pseudonocardia nigra]